MVEVVVAVTVGENELLWCVFRKTTGGAIGSRPPCSCDGCPTAEAVRLSLALVSP
jgi:hypothetical protein